MTDAGAGPDDGRTVVGRRACARPDGCCAGGPPAGWCDQLRASLAGAPDGLPALVSPFPRLGAIVGVAQGPGRVTRVQVRRALVSVRIDATGELLDVPLDALASPPSSAPDEAL
jgi:hypothetical protein